MPWWAPFVAAGKFIGEAALWTAGAEAAMWLGRKAWGWITRRRAQAAAKEAAEALATRASAALRAEQIAKEIERLRALAQEAMAKGDVRTARIIEREIGQRTEALAMLTATAQISHERRINQWLSLASTAAMVGFTIEEWRGASLYHENQQLRSQMEEMRMQLEKARMEQFAQYINTLKQRMLADEQNRAFWAWYMQQKFALEQMKQEAMALRRGFLSARGRAGRASTAWMDKVKVEQAKAYTKAVEQAWRAWRAWQEAMAQVNVENVKAMNEQQLLTLRGRWEAFLTNLEHAHKQREIAMKALADVWEEIVKGNIQFALEQQKFAHEAQLTAMKEQAETAREIIEAQAEVQAAAIEAIGRVKEAAEKGFWDLIQTRYKEDVKMLMRGYAEINTHLREAAEAIKEGKPYEAKIAVWTPKGIGFVTVRVKGKRIRVDLDKKAREAAIRYRVEHKITVHA